MNHSPAQGTVLSLGHSPYDNAHIFSAKCEICGGLIERRVSDTGTISEWRGASDCFRRMPRWIVIGNARIDGQMQVEFHDEQPRFLMPGQTLAKEVL